MDRREFIKSMGMLGASLYLPDMEDKDYDESCATAKELDKCFEKIEKSIYLIASDTGNCGIALIKGFVHGRNVLTVSHGIPKDRNGKSRLVYSPNEAVEIEDVFIDHDSDIAIFSYPRILTTREANTEMFRLNECDLKIGDAEKLKKGDYVFGCFSYGHPMQLIFTEGKVSTMNEDLIYHSMPTYPGDSGSPVFALYDGEPHLIGIEKGWGQNDHIYMKGGMFPDIESHKLAQAIKINKYRGFIDD